MTEQTAAEQQMVGSSRRLCGLELDPIPDSVVRPREDFCYGDSEKMTPVPCRLKSVMQAALVLIHCGEAPCSWPEWQLRLHPAETGAGNLGVADCKISQMTF